VKRTFRIKRKLLRHLFVLLLVTCGAILFVTIRGANKAVKDLSELLIIQTADRIEAELNGFFAPVQKSLLVARDWGRQGLFDLSDARRLNGYFIPLLKQHRQISSVIIARAPVEALKANREPSGPL